jgi:integrase
MRTFRPTYTVPRPAGAKVLDRADGKWVKFKAPRSGEEVEGKLSKSGKRVRFETKCWYCEFLDHAGILRRVKLLDDEAASQRMSATIQDLLNARCSGQGIDRDLQRRMEGLPKPIRVNLAQWGLLAEKAMAAMKSLTELIAIYGGSLRARERTQKYVTTATKAITRICDKCGFVFFADIDAGKVESYLKRRRDDGLSFNRSNLLLTYIKGFVKWCLDSGYATESPLRTLKKLNAKEDRRRIRRALEVEELKRLIATTATAKPRHGLTGHERSLIYALASTTGLRANEIRTLTVGALHFDTLTLELGAKREKNRKGNVLPLRADIAAVLRTYIGDKPPTARVFDGLVTERTAEMLRADLAFSGIPYEDAEGRIFDFHCLRGQFGTMLAAAGIHPKAAQQLMRHSDVNLTMNLYTHTLRGQDSQAVAQLPSLSVEQEAIVVRTGTDGESEILSKSCFADTQIQTRTNTDSGFSGPKPCFPPTPERSVSDLECFACSQPGEQARAESAQDQSAGSRIRNGHVPRRGARIGHQDVAADRAVLECRDRVHVGRKKARVPEIAALGAALRVEVAPHRDARAVEIDNRNRPVEWLKLESEQVIGKVRIAVGGPIPGRVVVHNRRSVVENLFGCQIVAGLDEQMARVALQAGAVEDIMVMPGQIVVLRHDPGERDGLARRADPAARAHQPAVGAAEAAGVYGTRLGQCAQGRDDRQ